MRILPPVEEKIRRTIRDARALDPLITVSGLQKTLEKKLGRTFTRKYIAKLADKVARQALIDADRTQVEERLNQLRETHRLARERLLRILYWSPENSLPGIKAPLPMDILEAAKNIVMLDIAVMKAEIDNGMYKKPIEERAKEVRYEPLAPEVRAVVIAAWTRGGLLPAPAIEAMVPQQVIEIQAEGSGHGPG